MVEILKLKVEWYFGWATRPQLQVLIDERPQDYRYQYRPDEYHPKPAGSYWAEKDGVVRFFWWNGKQDSGYGGSHYHITLEDDEQVTLKGPWSSGSHHMNNYFPHCMPVSLTDEPEVMERGHTYWAGNMLVDKLQEAVKKLRPELEIRKDPRWNDQSQHVYCIQCADGRYRPSYSEAAAWGDDPHATSSFRERLKLGLETEEEQDLFQKNWYSPWWEAWVGVEDIQDRIKASREHYPKLVAQWEASRDLEQQFQS